MIQGINPEMLRTIGSGLQEAGLAFRMMKETRDKLVTAYKEVISTQAP